MIVENALTALTRRNLEDKENVRRPVFLKYVKTSNYI